MKFENILPRLAWRLLKSRPILADKVGLLAKDMGRTTDLFLKTWLGKVGIVIILFFVFLAIFAQVAVPYDPRFGSDDIRQDSSWKHPFGTDDIGRDVLVRTIHGTSASLTVGFVAMVISMGVGTVVGLAS